MNIYTELEQLKRKLNTAEAGLNAHVAARDYWAASLREYDASLKNLRKRVAGLAIAVVKLERKIDEGEKRLVEAIIDISPGVER